MKLVIEDETGTRSVLPFGAGEVTVGRAAEGNRYRLPDRDVSRRHARFLLVNGVPFVEDLGSLTGTRVNGEKIAGRRKLREGDLVEIGSYDLAVVPDDGLAEVAGPGAPPPLPGPPSPPPAPPAVAAPAVTATAPTSAPARPAPAAPDRRFLLLCLAVFALAVVAGAVAGALTR
jgi:predicted component of type VI protein secretion system